MIEKTVEGPEVGSSNPWKEVPYVEDLRPAKAEEDVGGTAASDSPRGTLRVIVGLPDLGPLSKPIVARLYSEDGVLFAECSELEAVESGRSDDEALVKLLQLVAEDYVHWTAADDNALTAQARDLKRKYLALRQ